jgi:hypothetical protein
MNKALKKFSKAGIAAIMGVGILATANFTYASDDDHDFSFTLKPSYQNNYSGSRYRQTTSSSNPWKVDFTYSSEGAGTYATFWLDKSGTLVSGTKTVKQGSGAKYYSAYGQASGSNVRLGAENNNNSPNSYSISGYWDEETW